MTSMQVSFLYLLETCPKQFHGMIKAWTTMITMITMTMMIEMEVSFLSFITTCLTYLTTSLEAMQLPHMPQNITKAVQMVEASSANEYTYFNPKILDKWAGPNHWKYQKSGIICNLSYLFTFILFL